MLRVENLSTSYKTLDGQVNVLDNLNFTIHKNEIFGIAGESGCGKTTLLRVLYDILDYPLQIDSGRVVLSGEHEGESFEYESRKIKDAWWKHISYVPQAAQSVLNPILRVKEQADPEARRGLSRGAEPLCRPTGCLPLPAIRRYETAGHHRSGHLHGR
mgnify:CR=1 FL=1